MPTRDNRRTCNQIAGFKVFPVLGFGLIDGFNNLRIFCRILTDNISSTIRGSIIMDKDLKRGIRLLNQNPLKTPLTKLDMIVDWTLHHYLGNRQRF